MKKAIEGTMVTFTFNDGVAPITFDTETASVECQRYAIAFGFGHRLGDNAAGCKTEQERRDAVKELADHYATGTVQWNIRIAAEKKLDPFIQTIAEKKGIPYAEAKAWYQAKVLADMEAELG